MCLYNSIWSMLKKIELKKNWNKTNVYNVIAIMECL